MTRKLILATVLLLSLTMVSCGTNKTATDPNSSTSSEQSSNDTSTSSENENNTDVETESKTQENAKSKEINLSIYSIDENSLEPNEVTSISIDQSLTLNDKLNELAETVSKTNFNGLPIEVKSIDTIDGKNVATINLTDSGNNTWRQKFQGSTGGQVTANTLIENFLQSNNKSETEWIDGVKFLYNNEAIEYEHAADLSTINFRN